ncbi:DNA primase [Actinomyces naeslundii]|uniref:DNA primase n=1 Tax=Actinomyces naeslundii TaxID=1655 RepID=A0AA47FHI5_ACTNA|nr:DNA primase [Actinomyces naeslundii]OMG12002.1 DNA primase [Actinomyces naeslundii]OMG16535.1 DNA primase [Actinomyces naeslundii]PKY94007.1 DNA primase [Actinomyces naeslundii]WAL42073.1 DNA primase [Actinomyces naeslundii]
MAGLIRREDIEAVRERARIEDVVGEHVTLKNAGVGSLKGLCPFHDERTPSFHVRPQLGYWHCFGCGEGGDVITFIEKINHLGFAEAVEYLADRTGVQLRYEEGGAVRRGVEPGTRQRLMDANRLAEAWFREQLATPEAQAGRDFLTARGFDRHAAAHFGVGYAPAGWDNLARHLRGAGYTEAELVDSGLCSRGGQDGRRVYDRFRGRLIWPIRDVTGATVGFGARKLAEDDQGPKYLNTPETLVFHKSQVLYGLDLAKREVARSHRIVVVEGYTDVMAAHLSGVTTAVATCGTAFGADHVRVVRRLLGDIDDPAAGVVTGQGREARGGEVIFTFDGDAAGQKAALRAYAEDQRFATQTFVAVDPGGLDPCDLRMKEGDQGIPRLLSRRVPLFEFVIRTSLSHLDLDTSEGRVRGLRSAAPVVAGIRDRALKREYTRRLAGWLGLPDAEVHSAVQAAGRRSQQPSAVRGGQWPADDTAGPDAAAPVRGLPPVTDPVEQLEREALAVIVQFPVAAHQAGADELGADSFGQLTHRAVYEAVAAAGGTGEVPGLVQQAVAAGMGEQEAQRRATLRWLQQVRDGAIGLVEAAITELAVAPLPLPTIRGHGTEVDALGLERYAKGVLGSLAIMGINRQLVEMRSRHRRMSPQDEGYREIFSQIAALEQRRMQIRQGA